MYSTASAVSTTMKAVRRINSGGDDGVTGLVDGPFQVGGGDGLGALRGDKLVSGGAALLAQLVS